MDHIEITDATEKTHKLTDMRIEGEHKLIKILQKQLLVLSRQVEL